MQFGWQCAGVLCAIVKMAAGKLRVGAEARDRWIDDPGTAMCGDEDLAVTVTRLER